MTQVRPAITPAKIDAFAACALAWLVRLVGLLLVLGEPRWLRRYVRRLERHVENIVFLMAIRRAGKPPPRPPRRRVLPLTARVGFRRSGGAEISLFLKHARIRLRGARLSDRVLRLIEALADPEPHIARFIARLMRGLRRAGYVPVAPPSEALNAAPAYAAASNDSS